MLALVFSVEDEKYALACRRVVEVLPLVALRKLDKVPPFVAGLLDYGGTIVPVVDITSMLRGKPSASIISSRLIVVHYQERLLGLLAEKVTHTVTLDPTKETDSGVEFQDADYLGPVHAHQEGVIQLISVEKLLSEELKRLLFQKAAETGT